MRLFKSKNKDKKAKHIINKSSAKNSILFAIGCLISALSFNLFFVPNNFVGGGLSGFAIVINNIFPAADVNLIILVGNILLVLFSIITLGFKESLMSVIGALFYTVFVYLTEFFPEMWGSRTFPLCFSMISTISVWRRWRRSSSGAKKTAIASFPREKYFV